jgi:curli biogenesis system outer membrane secretion channel CsgG
MTKLIGSTTLICLLAGSSLIAGGDKGDQQTKDDLLGASKKPRARIAVAQFINNTGGFEAQMQRMAVQMQAQMAGIARESMEFQKKMIPYQNALMQWQAKVAAVGEEEAGPPPEPPEFETVPSSPYMASVSDPVAGGLRDMMIRALHKSKRFIVLERAEIHTINWEQEFSRSGHVGEETVVPIGEIEGAELILIGSINTLEADQSGGSVGGILSAVESAVPYSGGATRVDEATEADISWKRAMVTMDMRLVDTRTSRVVATTTVTGKATDVGFEASKSKYTWNAGKLPQGLSLYKKTPVEKAFRKMVDKAVQFLIDETPGKFFRSTSTKESGEG